MADKQTELVLSSGFRPFHPNGDFLSPSQSPWLHAVLVCCFPGSCDFGAPSGGSRHRISSIYALSLMALPDTSPHCLGLGLIARRQPRLIASERTAKAGDYVTLSWIPAITYGSQIKVKKEGEKAKGKKEKEKC